MHKNLFVALSLNNVCWILWYTTVLYQPEVWKSNPVRIYSISHSIVTRTDQEKMNGCICIIRFSSPTVFYHSAYISHCTVGPQFSVNSLFYLWN